MNEPIYIVDGARTPFAKSGTTLADYDAVELGKAAVSLLLARTGIKTGKIQQTLLDSLGPPPPLTKQAPRPAAPAGVGVRNAGFVFIVPRRGKKTKKMGGVIGGWAGPPPYPPSVAGVGGWRAGFLDSFPAITVHRNCASG